MNSDLAVLAGAGPEWSRRIKRLASNAPGLDIFTEGYVIRDAAGWQITDAGRKALQRMDSAPSAPQLEAPTPPAAAKRVVVLVTSAEPSALRPAATVIQIADRRRLPRRAI